VKQRLLGRMAQTFDALHTRNFRLFFTGQIISVSGTWMQTVAQAWLVLRLTGSGVDLGVVTATQWLPMLLFGTWGGVVADRFDKRRVLVGTQLAAGLLALALGILTATGTVRLWMVFVLAAGLGAVNTIDNPTRQSFVMEMVGRDRVTNAVTLNSVVMNGARITGPALAGVLIATVGTALCFLLNAGSYLAVILALMLMRHAELTPAEPVVRAKGQIKAGLRYVWSTPALRTPLLLITVVGTLAYNFNVTLSLMARYTFHSGAGAYGAMTSAMGLGAVVGGLVSAGRGEPTGRRLAGVAITFGVLILVTSVMPDLPAELVSLAVMGAFSITFIATANTTLQLGSTPEMRGRVMALYAVAFLGTTPIGSPIVGWVSQAFGARVGIGLGGVATLVAGLVAWPALTGRAPAASLRRLRVVAPAPEDAVAAL
jgi:MFS family permease